MHIETKGDITTIRYTSCEQIAKAKLAGFFLLLFPGIPLLSYGNYFEYVRGFWLYVTLFYVSAAVVLFLYGSYERKIEIHPERIYVKNYLLEAELEYPIKKGEMVLMIENSPYLQLIIPREKWRILIGYKDEVFFFSEDIENYQQTREIVRLLSQKLDIPVIDYTYKDQSGIIMYLRPGDLDLPFTGRAVKFKDLLVTGEIPTRKAIHEEIISTRKKIYKWTAFTWRNLSMATLVAGALAFMTFADIISIKGGLIDAPFLFEKQNIYYLIGLGYLATLAYYSGIRKNLTLETDKFKYENIFFGKTVNKSEIDAAKIKEVRVKPSPRGFVCLVIAKDNFLELKAHSGGLEDFANLLWLTGKIQDFLLQNREPEQKAEDGEQKMDNGEQKMDNGE
ncbi:MAG: hypothetical protein K8T10_18875 [Candidatus Eremiobacteraeota bacterium]|nr:hypothetical protein [Candidatus Eremiobacteraeota bacterium]